MMPLETEKQVITFLKVYKKNKIKKGYNEFEVYNKFLGSVGYGSIKPRISREMVEELAFRILLN